MPLSDTMINVLVFIEQCWWEEGAIPTNEAVIQNVEVSLPTLTRYWQDDDFRRALSARGIKFDGKSESKALTLIQLTVANMLMNTLDKRSLREKLKEPIMGEQITPMQVNSWMRQPAFQEHMRRRAETLFQGSDAFAYKGLVSAMESGDLKAIQLFFEMRGIYNPKVTHDVNVTVLLTRLVEIVSLHVKDPVTLAAIAADIEALTQVPNQGALPVGQ